MATGNNPPLQAAPLRMAIRYAVVFLVAALTTVPLIAQETEDMLPSRNTSATEGAAPTIETFTDDFLTELTWVLFLEHVQADRVRPADCVFIEYQDQGHAIPVTHPMIKSLLPRLYADHFSFLPSCHGRPRTDWPLLVMVFASSFDIGGDKVPSITHVWVFGNLVGRFYPDLVFHTSIYNFPESKELSNSLLIDIEDIVSRTAAWYVESSDSQKEP